MRFATLVDKKRGVRDDIKYTGWVEFSPTVPTSSSHRSSTVHVFEN